MHITAVQEDGLHVTCNAYQVLGEGNVEKRDLTVQVNGREPFNCFHYQLCCWPDHGVPKETSAIRELMEAVNSVRPNASHCKPVPGPSRSRNGGAQGPCKSSRMPPPCVGVGFSHVTFLTMGPAAPHGECGHACFAKPQ